MSLTVIAAGPSDRRLDRIVDAEQSITAFTGARPGTYLDWHEGRIARVYGRAFSSGPSAFHSAKSFVDDHAEMFGVPVADLVASGPFADGRHLQPMMYEEATGEYKFTGCFYTQVRDGVPVFRSRLNILCRNDADHAVVLAAADLRDLGEFTPNPARAVADLQMLTNTARGEFGPLAVITEASPVIYAGADDEGHAPTLAFETYVSIDYDRWLLVIEAETNKILFREHRIHFVGGDVSGTVSGNATLGASTAECEPEVLTGLPYASVTSGLNSTFTDVNGNYSITPSSPGIATIESSMDGEWFTLIDWTGATYGESVAVGPPGPGDMNFNDANVDEFERAAVNAYLHANIVRDFAVSFNPSYPTLNDGGFPVWVNRTDNFCPANAWYSPGDVTINFCQADTGAPNTAWTSVVYHEYGHHLVNAAGSGQGMYGEGMGDVMSAIILDDSRLGAGWGLNCLGTLRSADNDLQYPCSGSSHFCGQLISGCVWDTRNALTLTEPDNYTDILGNLAVNAMLLHTGTNITPQITIDYLTLDDDNGDIMDGTPHYSEIQAGFSAHNMAGPELSLVAFNLPEGTPSTVDPAGPETFPVDVISVTSSPVEDSGMIHVSPTGAPGSFVASAMTETSPNSYDAQLPPGTCGEQAYYFFSVSIDGGGTVVYPSGGQSTPFASVYATDSVQTFSDDFEGDLGWGLTGNVSAGSWERGVPAGAGDRGDPTEDADGSGSCYLTENGAGNTDVDNGTTTLTSPLMDATQGAAFISYWRWYSNVEGTSSMDDIFQVEVNDGTSGWVELETVGPAGDEVSGGWYFKQFRIEDFVGLTNQFQIRFTASDTDPQSIVEAAVDGITLDAFSCSGESCDADTNGDMNVNVDDLVAVIKAWGSVGPNAADVNNDLVVNVDDLVDVIANWGACP